jgi:hypothetical protein
MGKEFRDFYYSDESFKLFKLGNYNEDEVVCECFIDGKWLPYTETIDAGMKPLSVWEDLKYLGSSNETRYTKATEWIKAGRQTQTL